MLFRSAEAALRIALRAHQLLKGVNNAVPPPDRLTSTLAEEDAQYLIYLPFGGEASLEIPVSSYELLNPRTGEIVQSGQAPAGTFRFAAPDDQDWIVYIRRT